MASKDKNASPVTMRTIADKLGVSVTTVSRSLDDGYKTSPVMVARVRATADKLGYVRNLDGLKLRTGKTLVMMALLGVSKEEEVGDSGSAGLLNGIHQRFAETEYSLRTIPVSIDADGLDHVKEVVRGRNADGLILDHTVSQDSRIRYLQDRRFPFVTFGRSASKSEHPYFDIDNEYAAWQGATSLIRSGYQRLAFLDADPEFEFVRQRLRGYRKALQEAGLAFDPALIRHIPMQADLARDAARVLLRKGADSFVCVNEMIFLGARAGVRLEQADLLDNTGFSVRTGTRLAEYIGTPVHASHYSRMSAGWHLADTLLRSVEGAGVKQCQKIVRTELRLHGVDGKPEVP